MIAEQLRESRFDFVSSQDKAFITAFTESLEKLGYTYGGEIGSGVCWGRYMLIFRRANVKSKYVAARIYIRDSSIALRIYCNQVTKHADYIRSAPSLIRDVFTGEYGACTHCRGDQCKFRKIYEIDGKTIEKCNGLTFTFDCPQAADLPEYLALFQEFYRTKKSCW
ncbi:MAG: hypothetical protein K2P22_07355, partial [Lachnospiraceae bacterium]|nr:hypothetical protein [Lachnospiraceae bacterium]